MMMAMINATIEKTKTAAAAKSLIFPAVSWCSGLIKLTKCSIAVLTISKAITAPMQIRIIHHSIAEIFKNQLAIMAVDIETMCSLKLRSKMATFKPL